MPDVHHSLRNRAGGTRTSHADRADSKSGAEPSPLRRSQTFGLLTAGRLASLVFRPRKPSVCSVPPGAVLAVTRSDSPGVHRSDEHVSRSSDQHSPSISSILPAPPPFSLAARSDATSIGVTHTALGRLAPFLDRLGCPQATIERPYCRYTHPTGPLVCRFERGNPSLQLVKLQIPLSCHLFTCVTIEFDSRSEIGRWSSYG